MAHNFRTKWFRFFYPYKKPKICKLQDAQKCRPRAEFGIWQDGSSNFHGRIRFWAFQLAILAGKAILSTFPVAPPIIVSEILEISKMIIGGATGKVLKMAFPANMASWKAQNLILPWKLDDHLVRFQIQLGAGISEHLEVCIFLALLHRQKKNHWFLGLKFCAMSR